MRQIGQHVHLLRQDIRGRMLRHHISADPGTMQEWREAVGNIGTSQLLRCAESGGLGQLIGCFSASAASYELVVEGTDRRLDAPGNAAEHYVRALSGIERDLATCEAYASGIVAHWHDSLRQVGRSQRLARRYGIGQSVLRHVIDEISIGAGRIGLTAHLTEALLHSNALALEQPARGRRIAAYAWHIIGNYIEYLDLPGGFSTPDIPASSPTAASILWCRAFGRLLEANIAAMPSMGSASERDRELGNPLAQLTSTNVEVDL